MTESDGHAAASGLARFSNRTASEKTHLSHSSLHLPAPTYGFSSLAQLARFGFTSHFTFEERLTVYSTL